MVGHSLNHLRLAFGVLGAVLLVPLALLLHSAVERLEGERALRHEMVAERIFDELERELTDLLRRESDRPSSAFATRRTQVRSWAPFVVGYFTRQGEVLRVVAEEQLGDARLARLQGAVSLALEQPLVVGDKAGADSETDWASMPAETSPNILRQLNRSRDGRARVAPERARSEAAKRFAVRQPDARTLVFARRRLDGDDFEGLVVDVDSLVGTLKARVLEARGLGEVADVQAGDGVWTTTVAGQYLYGHRFAPPFSSVSASLRLSALQEADAAQVLYPLAALLAVFVVLGLIALYRMVSVQVRFAQQQNNFVSAVSHELKTPLTAIRMYGEMLRDGLVEDEGRRAGYYTTITAESERLTRLIDNVLELSRLQRRGRHAQCVVGDVVPVLREALDILEPHAQEQGFEIVLEGPAHATARFEPDGLKQVLFNVLDNALKYSADAAERRVSVRCEPQPGQLVLSVRDWGPGVDGAKQHAVFQPFFRGEDELTRKRKGTGIGLALVKGIVERMGGRVSGRNRTPGFELSIVLPSTAPVD